METFLHLVPIATIATDYEASEALVYGEDEAADAVADSNVASALSEQLQRHVFAAATGSSSDNNTSNGSNGADMNDLPLEQRQASQCHALEACERAESLVDPDERERRAYLTRAKALEAQMEHAKRELQQRLDAMAHILALSDPLEQLSEYTALKLDERCSGATVDVTAELVECGQRLTNEADSEIALLGAFFFSCDAPPCPTTRGVASLLPVVAAMMESGDSATSTSLEQPMLI